MLAWGLGKEYYDGSRQNGYGGFRYDGRWGRIVPYIVSRYGLTPRSRVLDVGCKKGFFLHDLQAAVPGISVTGIENHPYPIEHAMASVRPYLIQGQYEELPFPADAFDFVLAFASVYMLNLGGVMAALREIERVSHGRSYVTVGAYRTPEERDAFLRWTLIGTTVLHVSEWLELFAFVGYTGDYGFTTGSTLGLTKAGG
jgi:SAM-dependent methyltransferase